VNVRLLLEGHFSSNIFCPALQGTLTLPAGEFDFVPNQIRSNLDLFRVNIVDVDIEVV